MLIFSSHLGSFAFNLTNELPLCFAICYVRVNGEKALYEDREQSCFSKSELIWVYIDPRICRL